MKRIGMYIFLFTFPSLICWGQSSVQKILTSVENNSKTLKAARQLTKVKKIDAKTGIYPQDMSVEYEHLWGNGASDNQRESELTVTQELDFPTVYFQKNKIAGMKSEQADIQYNMSRRDILYEAKTVCVELVYLNKNGMILNRRMEVARKLNDSYRRLLEIGDANILEVNKIGLELLNTQNEIRINEIEINNRLRKLSELNGGEPITFSDTVYFEWNMPVTYEAILQKSLQDDPELKNLEQEKNIANRSVGLAKNMSLPKLNVGYKMNVSSPEKYYGFVAGVSIPLWENKNTVKRAKAESVLAEMEIDNYRFNQSNNLKQLYEKSLVLKESCNEYKKLLVAQNNWAYLNKALLAGQISLLKYLTEATFLYQSVENFLQIERDYYLAVTELLKADL